MEFLRIGRTLLVYQTSDQETTGWFNPVTREYEDLPDRYRLEVKEGLAIARNEKAPGDGGRGGPPDCNVPRCC